MKERNNDKLKKAGRKSLAMLILTVFCLNLFGQGHNEYIPDHPPVVPAWAFQPWVWEDSINTREGALKLIRLYKEHDIPVGAIIIDSPWSTAYNNFKWDTVRYPDPRGMIEEMHREGVRVVMWLTGFINSMSTDVPVQKSNDYNYVIQHQYVVDDGREAEWWKGRGVHIDFTNPEAVKWFHHKLDKILDMHIDGFKIDQGNAALNIFRVNTSIGVMRSEQFGKYYYDSVAAYGMSKNPEFVNMARGYSYQAGSMSGIEFLQTTFQGDFSGNWTGLNHQIDNTYKTARLGYGAPGFEIGGFMDEASSKKEFIRYAQFGSMCPVMDNGGGNGAFSFHLPWFHGEDVADIYRYFATLHAELTPYLFSESVDAHLTGGSIIKNTSFVNASHQLGKWIFVKAITSENDRVNVQLPAGSSWIDYWTGEKYKGGSLLSDRVYSLNRFPVFLRAGAVIPMFVANDVTGHGDENSGGKLTVLIYPDGVTDYVFHRPKGTGVEYEDVQFHVDAQKNTISIESDIDDSYVFLIYTGGNDYKKIERSGKRFTVKY